MDQEDTVIHSLANPSSTYDKGPGESVLKGLGVAVGGRPPLCSLCLCCCVGKTCDTLHHRLSQK